MIIKLRKILFFILAAFVGGVSAQSSSSYTRIGIGDIQYSYSARSLGMGQAGAALSNSDFVNMVNPASLNALTRTRLETGVSFNGLILNDNGASTYYGEAEFSGFTFAFPVSSKYGIGAAIGILPYSNISYEVSQDVSADELNDEDYRILYEGSGGLSKLFLGSSYTLPFDLTIGASLDYYFGNLNYISKTEFVNTRNRNAEYKRTYAPRGAGGTFGIITPEIFKTESINNFRLGAAISIISELTADTVLSSSSSAGIDTIGSGISNMKVPLRITAGLGFTLNTNYLFNVDYVMQPWSEYEFNNTGSSKLRDAMKLSAGFEYRPSREPGATFWEQIIWRAGLSYEETQYTINGTGINQYSVSGGFSMPLSPENTLDLGLEYASRGSSDAGLYKENIVRMNVGISLGEIWFIRHEK